MRFQKILKLPQTDESMNVLLLTLGSLLLFMGLVILYKKRKVSLEE